MNPSKLFMGKERAQARRGMQAYDEMTRPGAKSLQEMLVNLIGQNEPGNPETARAVMGRMAMDDNMLRLLQAMPAAAAVGGVVGAGDIVAGEESFANKTMDLLGMGAGAYGINRGVNRLGGTTAAGKALAMAAGLGIGKMGSDAVQGGIGGIL